MLDEDKTFEQAAKESVELGNQLANTDLEADLWDIADGILAGAIQYWLYSRQPCGDPKCDECAPIATSHERLSELAKLTDQFARDSEYFHTAFDNDVGHA